jgi:hypothetical protein
MEIFMATYASRNEARELTDADLDIVSGGNLADIANDLSNALAGCAVKGWSDEVGPIPTNGGPYRSIHN